MQKTKAERRQERNERRSVYRSLKQAYEKDTNRIGEPGDLGVSLSAGRQTVNAVKHPSDVAEVLKAIEKDLGMICFRSGGDPQQRIACIWREIKLLAQQTANRALE